MNDKFTTANSYTERVKFFLKEKGLNNRELTKLLGYKSETLVSRYVNSEDMSITFILKMVNAFPDLDLNWLIKDNYVPQTSYDLISENAKLKKIIEDLKALLA
jgi:transcriptional regulator with XRE-family HTH domain